MKTTLKRNIFTVIVKITTMSIITLFKYISYDQGKPEQKKKHPNNIAIFSES